MKLKPLGSNQTELTLNNGVTVLFSYQTPVAAHIPGRGFVRTEQHYSKTTTGHINKWLAGAKADKVPQETIETLSSGRYNENPRRGPGKFGDAIEEVLYAGPDQETGSVDELGWYGLVSGMLKQEARELAQENEIELTPEDEDEYDWPLNAIINENSDGHISVETFKNNRDAIRRWREIEREYERYYGDEG